MTNPVAEVYSPNHVVHLERDSNHVALYCADFQLQRLNSIPAFSSVPGEGCYLPLLLHLSTRICQTIQ